MTGKSLGRLFSFAVEAHRERAERYRDYKKESRSRDRYSDRELEQGMDRERYVGLGDVRKILASVRRRMEFNCDECDIDEYAGPVFSLILARIQKGEMDCYVDLLEDVAQSGRVKVGDILEVMNEFDLPDGHAGSPGGTETVAKPVEQEFDTSTGLGRLRHFMSQAFPLRTPSVEVTYEQRGTNLPLNVKRPFLLSLGLASVHKDQTRAVNGGLFTTYRETAMQRRINEQKPKPPRYYRTHRID